MKKLLIITILMFGALSMKAQESHFGAKLGLGMTSLSVSGDDEFFSNSEGNIGLTMGVVGEFMLNDQFAIAPELNYISAGDSFKLTSDLDLSLSLSYIQIPLMLKYYFNDSFCLYSGAQIGFLMSAESKFNGASNDVKDEFNSTDFGMNIGAGYKMENGLFVDLRYTAGLSDIYKNEYTTLQNKGFQFGIGYFFN